MIAVALIGPQVALGTFPGRNGLIAVGGEGFELTCPSYEWDIHVLYPDGSGLRPLTASGRCSSAERRWAPDWTADGRRLVFFDSSTNFVGSMSADGSDVQRLPRPAEISVIDGQPSISPDGQLVLFDTYEDNYFQIWLERLDGTGLRRLRRGTSPRWSPSSRMIVFAANDGRLVVRDAATDELLLARRFPRHDVLSVDWAPGERRILMVMDPWRGRRWLATVAVGNPASRPHRIRLPHRFRSTRWRLGGPAVMSPDGRRIAFIAYRRAGYEGAQPSLWVMRADGQQLKRLLVGGTSIGEAEESVSWQPILP